MWCRHIRSEESARCIGGTVHRRRVDPGERPGDDAGAQVESCLEPDVQPALVAVIQHRGPDPLAGRSLPCPFADADLTQFEGRQIQVRIEGLGDHDLAGWQGCGGLILEVDLVRQQVVTGDESLRTDNGTGWADELVGVVRVATVQLLQLGPGVPIRRRGVGEQRVRIHPVDRLRQRHRTDVDEISRAVDEHTRERDEPADVDLQPGLEDVAGDQPTVGDVVVRPAVVDRLHALSDIEADSELGEPARQRRTLLQIACRCVFQLADLGEVPGGPRSELDHLLRGRLQLSGSLGEVAVRHGPSGHTQQRVEVVAVADDRRPQVHRVARVLSAVLAEAGLIVDPEETQDRVERAGLRVAGRSFPAAGHVDPVDRVVRCPDCVVLCREQLRILGKESAVRWVVHPGAGVDETARLRGQAEAALETERLRGCSGSRTHGTERQIAEGVGDGAGRVGEREHVATRIGSIEAGRNAAAVEAGGNTLAPGVAGTANTARRVLADKRADAGWVDEQLGRDAVRGLRDRRAEGIVLIARRDCRGGGGGELATRVPRSRRVAVGETAAFRIVGDQDAVDRRRPASRAVGVRAGAGDGVVGSEPIAVAVIGVGDGPRRGAGGSGTRQPTGAVVGVCGDAGDIDAGRYAVLHVVGELDVGDAVGTGARTVHRAARGALASDASEDVARDLGSCPVAEAGGGQSVDAVVGVARQHGDAARQGGHPTSSVVGDTCDLAVQRRRRYATAGAVVGEGEAETVRIVGAGEPILAVIGERRRAGRTCGAEQVAARVVAVGDRPIAGGGGLADDVLDGVARREGRAGTVGRGRESPERVVADSGDRSGGIGQRCRPQSCVASDTGRASVGVDDGLEQSVRIEIDVRRAPGAIHLTRDQTRCVGDDEIAGRHAIDHHADRASGCIAANRRNASDRVDELGHGGVVVQPTGGGASTCICDRDGTIDAEGLGEQGRAVALDGDEPSVCVAKVSAGDAVGRRSPGGQPVGTPRYGLGQTASGDAGEMAAGVVGVRGDPSDRVGAAGDHAGAVVRVGRGVTVGFDDRHQSRSGVVVGRDSQRSVGHTHETTGAREALPGAVAPGERPAAGHGGQLIRNSGRGQVRPVRLEGEAKPGGAVGHDDMVATRFDCETPQREPGITGAEFAR